MGQTCKQVQKQQTTPSTFQLSKLQPFANLTFTFTSDKVNRISCDSLIIFADSKMQLNRNQFLVRCGQKTADKIQAYCNAAKENKTIKQGQGLMIDIGNQQFGFHKICVVTLKVCQGNSFQSKNNPLQIAIEKSLQKLKQSKLKSIMFVQINEQFGLPKQKSFKIILDALQNYKTDFDDIGFVCYNEGSMGKAKITLENYGKSKQEDDKSNKSNSKVSQTSKASKQSEYY